MEKMDYSQYLRQKAKSQQTFIARQGCVDAGLRTYIKQKAAHSYYIPPGTNAAIRHTVECCPTHESMASSEITAVKPVSGCSASVACTQFNTPTNSHIVLPCCPGERPAPSIYLDSSVVGKCYCYQATPAQVAVAGASKCCSN